MFKVLISTYYSNGHGASAKVIVVEFETEKAAKVAIERVNTQSYYRTYQTALALF